MSRRMLGVFTAVAAALLVVGVAWASGGDAPSSSTIDDETGSSLSTVDTSDTEDSGFSTSTRGEDDNSTTSVGGTSTTTGAGASSTSSIGGGSTTTDDRGASSTTIPGSGSSTTNDDNSGAADGIETYVVGDAGTVTIEVRAGALVLVDVAPNSGWTFQVTKELPDAIDVRFEKGESEMEIEVDLEDGELFVSIG